MLRIQQAKSDILKLKPKLEELKSTLKIEKAVEQLEFLEKKTFEKNFWNSDNGSKEVLLEIKKFKNIISNFDILNKRFEETLVLIEIAIEENDSSIFLEIDSNLKSISKEIDNQFLTTLLSNVFDSNNAILSLQSGAGGTDAQDWLSMLYRMYVRWAESRKFDVSILNYIDGDEAGIKSATILIKGLNAYGFLKSESGIHRLIRISPFNSSSQRHTSFSAVEVIPEIDDDDSIIFKPEDLKIDTFRAGGAGGQHVNKTESAVRVTHIPTGITVSCQNERSQLQNKSICLKILKSKLAKIKQKEKLERIEDIKGDQKEIAWGSQIRSYTFMPYTLVKDHRTGCETSNINSVMDGDIDNFINSYLKYISSLNN